MEKITSTSNAKVQEIKKLLNSKKDRYLLQKFVAEGVNIVKDIPNKYIDSLFMTVETFEKYKNITDKCSNIYLVANKVIEGISDTKSPSGVVAVCNMPVCDDINDNKCMKCREETYALI